MKATGIVRRIDDLGRVVIPKEIRRTMRIREGDPLEIYTGADGEVIFKKYSPMGEMSSLADDFCTALSQNTRLGVAICDRDHCIAASKKELLEKAITPELEALVETRKAFGGESEIFALLGVDKRLCAMHPIVTSGDIVGSVCLFETETESTATDSDKRLLQLTSHFLSLRTE